MGAAVIDAKIRAVYLVIRIGLICKKSGQRNEKRFGETDREQRITSPKPTYGDPDGISRKQLQSLGTRVPECSPASDSISIIGIENKVLEVVSLQNPDPLCPFCLLHVQVGFSFTTEF